MNGNPTISGINIGHAELRRIITFNKTDHSYTTSQDKVERRSKAYTNNKLLCNGQKATRGNQHTIGCYMTNAAGKLLSSCYILDTKASHAENYQIKEY